MWRWLQRQTFQLSSPSDQSYRKGNQLPSRPGCKSPAHTSNCWPWLTRLCHYRARSSLQFLGFKCLTAWHRLPTTNWRKDSQARVASSKSSHQACLACYRSGRLRPNLLWACNLHRRRQPWTRPSTRQRRSFLMIICQTFCLWCPLTWCYVSLLA